MLVPVTAAAKAVPVEAEDREAVAAPVAVVPAAEIAPTPGHLLSRSSR